MLMLKRLEFAPGLFTMASLDAATCGSETQILVNVWESASIIDPWESVYQEAKVSLHNYGYGLDDTEAVTQLKDFYQKMRHGMSFDWVMNYAVSLIEKEFPFSRHVLFKHTQEFLDVFMDDAVFAEELARIRTDLQPILDWVFEGYPDPSVYKRLDAYSGGTGNLEGALSYLKNNPPTDQEFLIQTDTLDRTNYLVLLMEMLSLAIGPAKRQYWTDRVFGIKEDSPLMSGCVIVVGGKFNAFAYGDLDGTGVRWSKLFNGIKQLGFSERNQRPEYIRAFPDEMTFFRFANSALLLDETLFPKVAFGADVLNEDGTDGTAWLTTNDFKDRLPPEVVLDVPLRMRIKYPFEQRPGYVKTIKLKGSLNCFIKDSQIVLDAEGIAVTQAVFRGLKVSFKVSDADKQYPFAMFTTSQISSDTFAWL